MQAYFESEQAFFISMPQPVFKISIAYKKKHVNLLIIHAFLSQLFDAKDNLKTTRATH